MLHNALQCLTPYDIQFLECNLTTANSFIWLDLNFYFLFFTMSSVLSSLHYLIDKTSHYFDTLDIWKSKCVSERELTDMWSIWQMRCACSWSGASISLSFSFFPFCRAVQTHKLNHTSLILFRSHTHISLQCCVNLLCCQCVVVWDVPGWSAVFHLLFYPLFWVCSPDRMICP